MEGVTGGLTDPILPPPEARRRVEPGERVEYVRGDGTLAMSSVHANLGEHDALGAAIEHAARRSVELGRPLAVVYHKRTHYLPQAGAEVVTTYAVVELKRTPGHSELAGAQAPFPDHAFDITSLQAVADGGNVRVLGQEAERWHAAPPDALGALRHALRHGASSESLADAYLAAFDRNGDSRIAIGNWLPWEPANEDTVGGGWFSTPQASIAGLATAADAAGAADGIVTREELLAVIERYAQWSYVDVAALNTDFPLA